MGELLENDASTVRARQQIPSWRLAIVIVSLCLGIFLHGLDVNIVNVAIPQITTDFKSLDDIAWYGSAYLLTVTAFQPFFGSLYKLFPLKTLFISSLGIFEVGSIVCASAPASAVLIFGRALLGFGAAGLLQGALAIIGHIAPLDKVPFYQGIVVSSMGISVCLGPIVGGALTQYASWRWCFWVNVPAGTCVMIAIFLFVRIIPSHDTDDNARIPIQKKLRQLDLIGIVLFLGVVCCLLLVLQWAGQKYDWNSPRIIVLLVMFVVLLIAFCFSQWYLGDLAMIPTRVFCKRSIVLGAIVLMLLGMSNLVYAYYLPIYFQSIQGVSTTQSGTRFIALVLPQIVGLVFSGILVAQWGYYVPYMVAGIVVMCIGNGLLYTIDISTSTVYWAASMVISGFGLGFAQQLPYSAVQAVLEPPDTPTGNAIAVFSYQLGSALGIGVGQNLLLNKLIVEVSRLTDVVTPQEVIQAGATGLVGLAATADVLQSIRLAYSESIHYTFLFPLIVGCLSLPFACAMENWNLKQVVAERSRLQAARDESQAAANQDGVDGSNENRNCEPEGLRDEVKEDVVDSSSNFNDSG